MNDDDFYVEDESPDVIARIVAKFRRGEFDGYTVGPYERVTLGPTSINYWCHPIHFDLRGPVEEKP